MALFEKLEPRILLSADALPLPIENNPAEFADQYDAAGSPALPAETETAAPSTEPSPETPDRPSGEGNAVQGEEVTAVVDEGDKAAVVETVESTDSPKEMFFVGDDIDGRDELIAKLETSENGTVVILDSEADGVVQIAEKLSGESEVDAVHVFTHGSAGRIKLGDSWLDNDNVEDYRVELEGIGSALTESGDILLYGCDLTATGDGVRLIESIAAETGADVAASDDTTGHESMGGDWILETETGAVETGIPLDEAAENSWVHILGPRPPGPVTAADDFDSGTLGGGEGWNGDWVITGNPDPGRISMENGILKFISAAAGESEYSIEREVNLEGREQAAISFDLKGRTIDPGRTGPDLLAGKFF